MGQVYVVPIHATFRDIKNQLGAQESFLPNKLDIERCLTHCTPWLATNPARASSLQDLACSQPSMSDSAALSTQEELPLEIRPKTADLGIDVANGGTINSPVTSSHSPFENNGPDTEKTGMPNLEVYSRRNRPFNPLPGGQSTLKAVARSNSHSSLSTESSEMTVLSVTSFPDGTEPRLRQCPQSTVAR